MVSFASDVGSSIKAKPPPPKPAPKPSPKPSTPPATVAYNPAGYVPGGSSTKESVAIEAQAIATPGPAPVKVPVGIEAHIPLSTLVTTTSGSVETFGKAIGEGGPPPPAKPKPKPEPPAAEPGDTPADIFLRDAHGLAGAAAFQAIQASCDLYGIETKAACADGLHEGFGGGIGDGGEAYGPWQEHLTDGRIPDIAGLPSADKRVQQWAWSAPGIAHGVRGMADDSPSARGLSGHAAVHAIVYGFERPGDKAGAYTTRAAEYDHLVALGNDWQAYVIARLVGSGLPGTTTAPLVPFEPVAPTSVTGPANAWRGLLAAVAETLPGLGARAKKAGSNLPGV